MPKAFDAFLSEKYEKEALSYSVYDKYRKDLNRAILTPKFYSSHEYNDLNEAPLDLVELITQAKDRGPKQKHEWPATESQCYGWFIEPLIEINRSDRRFYQPKVTHDCTRFPHTKRKQA